MTDKKGLLPILNNDVRESVLVELRRDKDYSRNVLERLFEEDNTNLANFIANYAVASSCPQEMVYMGILVYRLLESQAEVDKMEG